MPFVKLNTNILYSSIWAEDAETCKVWITLLAMADCSGMVASTAPGISRLSCVPLESTDKALMLFESPDAYSKSQDDDGRRIRRVDGGYLVLNYDKYRERDNTAYERLKRYREKKAGLRRNQPLSPVSSASVSVSLSDYFLIFWKEYPRKVGKHNAEKAFNKLNPDKELFDRIMFQLGEQKRYWSDPQFIPHPSTWLNGKRWEDDLSSIHSKIDKHRQWCDVGKQRQEPEPMGEQTPEEIKAEKIADIKDSIKNAEIFISRPDAQKDHGAIKIVTANLERYKNELKELEIET